MADEHRHAHARRRHLDLRIEDLLGLGDHLPFLFRVAVFHEDVDVRNAVEGDFLGELLRRELLSWHVLALGLRPQLVHALFAGTRHRLISRYDDALDRRVVMQRLQCHDHLRRRAIRIGNDVLAAGLRHVLDEHVGVDLGHDQRAIDIVAPRARVIDDDGASRADLRAPFLRNRATGRHDDEIHCRKIECREVFAFERLLAERHFGAERPARRDGMHILVGEAPLN